MWRRADNFLTYLLNVYHTTHSLNSRYNSYNQYRFQDQGPLQTQEGVPAKSMKMVPQEGYLWAW